MQSSAAELLSSMPGISKCCTDSSCVLLLLAVVIHIHQHYLDHTVNTQGYLGSRCGLRLVLVSGCARLLFTVDLVSQNHTGVGSQNNTYAVFA